MKKNQEFNLFRSNSYALLQKCFDPGYRSDMVYLLLMGISRGGDISKSQHTNQINLELVYSLQFAVAALLQSSPH
jgi:hypothetical protein